MFRPTLCLLLFVLIQHIVTTTAQSIQYAKRFPKSRLYNLSPASLGLDHLDGTIAAFGDFNADKFSDIFVVGEDQKSITVYTWDHKRFVFASLPSASIHYDWPINNLVPGDYNYDGKLDLLVMGQPVDGQFHMRVYFGNGNDSFLTPALDIPSARNSLPMVLDLTGDMQLDLLGYAWDQKDGLSAWINTVQSDFNNQTTSIYNLTSASHLFDSTYSDQCQWASPHSNAFLDLDGDCLADVVMVCDNNGKQSVQIWTNQRENGFHLAQTFDLPAGAGPLAFADMDGDGSTDIIFTTCSTGGHCSIHTVYNQQMGLCSKADQNSSDAAQCRKPQHLCVADPEFRFDINSPNSKNYIIFDLDQYLDRDEMVLTLDRNFPGTMPVPIHPGDYNLDGYPDLLVTTTKKVMLLQSVWCTQQGQCSDQAIKSSKRTFSLIRSGAESLTRLANPRHATFFDIDEDGSLDILVLQAKSQTPSTERTPQFFINNYFNDAFFLKGLVSNGAHGSKDKPYGVNYPGANFKFTVLDTSGTKRVHQVSQLPQTGYMTLNTPYCLFGLGRTNNYVEEMFAGVTRHQDQNYMFYEGVIPNSQLVFLPYQPDHVTDSSSWKVELYVQPADYIPWVLVSLVAAAILLGVVVASLYWMEKREDERERRKALHIINFDAL